MCIIEVESVMYLIKLYGVEVNLDQLSSNRKKQLALHGYGEKRDG